MTDDPLALAQSLGINLTADDLATAPDDPETEARIRRIIASRKVIDRRLMYGPDPTANAAIGNADRKTKNRKKP
jgi:hypothetical protein